MEGSANKNKEQVSGTTEDEPPRSQEDRRLALFMREWKNLEGKLVRLQISGKEPQSASDKWLIATYLETVSKLLAGGYLQVGPTANISNRVGEVIIPRGIDTAGLDRMSMSSFGSKSSGGSAAEGILRSSARIRTRIQEIRNQIPGEN
jgi:hypothetical protein